MKKKKSAKNTTNWTRRNSDRETPFVVYNALKMYETTRSRDLVDSLNILGLGVSYERMLRLSSRLANGVITCPGNLHKNVFTTAALDNLGHYPRWQSVAFMEQLFLW